MSVQVNINGIHELDFDLGGTTTAQLTSPGVVKLTNTPITTELQGVPVSNVLPTSGQVLEFNGADWVPTTSGGGGGGSVIFGSGPPTAGVLQSTAVGGHSISFTSAVTSGNLLIIAYNSEGTITGVTISDTLWTSYTLVASISGHSVNMNVYAGVAPSSGINTVTIGSAPNNFDRMGAMEVVRCTSTVDVTATSYNGTTPYTLPITTTNASDFIFAAVAGFHSADVFAFGASFTLDSQSNGNDANAIGHCISSSIGTYTLQVTITGAGADNSPAILVAFKAGSPAAGTEGEIYFNTAVVPYLGYVYHSGGWHQFS
jgi:hypothetical protein